MKCLRYPEYKTTGFKWLGEVPSHWGVGRTSRYFQIAMGETILQENLEEDGTWPVFSATDGDQYLGKVSNPRVRLFPGDIVIPARGNSIGAVKLAREAATTSQTTIYCKRISPEKFISEYVFFFMRGCRANLFYFTQTAIPQITVGEVGANPILVPPILEQLTIVDFLDQETSKIDALISEQQRLIELLKEKRQAVISHAVTKGLNPDVRMKPSGVEWLGEVPEHWEISRLGFWCSKIGSGKTPLGGAETYQDEGVLFIRSQNVYDEGLLLDDVVYISSEEDEGMSTSRVLAGDILLNITGASLGRTCLVPEPFPSANVNQHVCIIRLREKQLAKYFGMLLKSAVVKEQFNFVQNGAAREGLNYAQISKAAIVVPSIEEQAEIVAYLEDTLAKLDALVAAAGHSIGLLQERRTALISAAVTGKIDVRNYAATQKDAA